MTFRPLALVPIALMLALAFAPAPVHAQDETPAVVEAAAEAMAEVEAAAEAATETEEAPAAVSRGGSLTPASITAETFYDGFELSTQAAMNHLWTLVAASLVFFMQAGFCCVTAGFCRAKNVCNILMKNTLDMAVGVLVFFAVGFGLMFGASEATGGWMGTEAFFMTDAENIQARIEAAVEDGEITGAPDLGPNWAYTFWLFQAVFAATAATIVSGAVAERIKFSAYLIYAAVVTAIIYPIQGSWFWGGLWAGGGWLESFKIGGYEYFVNDFAGSTVVHSTGAWVGLAAALVLGPRVGKYSKDGRLRVIPGHNLLMGSLGVFILFFGWFGFNAGSTTTADDTVGKIAMVTTLSGGAGTISALIISYIVFGRPDVGMTLNGCLGGLVGITAGCATTSPQMAIVTGLVAGGIIVGAVLLMDRVLKIDDPVGAVPVHGFCGMWGTLASALFMADPGEEGWTRSGQIVTHLVGIGANFVWCFGLGLILFLGLKAINQLRVSEEEEIEGLDFGEHGASGYPDFTTTVLK